MSTRFELYTYFRSSCSARVRIAALLKNVKLEYHYVHLLQNEQASSEYTQINPSGAVPTLRVTLATGEVVILRQSVAIIEYLEETIPDTISLLPPLSQSLSRARVRELVNIIACDVQPVTNMRTLNQAEALGVAKADWAHRFMVPGLSAYEKLASGYAGIYSVGDGVSMADVCLSPAVDGALRFGIDMKQFPTIARVYSSLQELDAFKQGGWKAQPDTPEQLRDDQRPPI